MADARPADDFWVKKLTYNMDRDRRQLEELSQNGWRVLRIWESDIKRKRARDSEIEKVISFLAA